MNQLTSIPTNSSSQSFGVYSILLVLFLNNTVKAQDNLDVVSDWIHFSDASKSLYHHLSGQAYDLIGEREITVVRICSLSERQEWVRETMMI